MGSAPQVARTSVENTAVFGETPTMPKEIFFSSYRCDGGHRIDFSENTVSEVKQKSKRKRQWLIETCDDPSAQHVGVFEGGEMVDLLCSDAGRRQKKTKFTQKQGPYLAFIHQSTKVHGVPPAEHERQRHFDVRPPSVHRMVINLEKKGLLERTPGMARSIRVLVPARNRPPEDWRNWGQLRT